MLIKSKSKEIMYLFPGLGLISISCGQTFTSTNGRHG